MFKAFYGFSKNPFEKQSLLSKEAFKSKDHTQMVARLDHLKNIRGIGVFTARSGAGKTYALRCFDASLDPNLYQLVYICLSTVTLTEFYRQLCRALGIEPAYSKSAMFKALQERLYDQFEDRRRPVILVIDEAHELATPILKELKMIANFKFDSLNCFSIALVGEPHLNNILEKSVHEALRQRIVIHYNFSGLTDDEAQGYVEHKLTVGGAARSILAEGAMAAICGYARGNPRLIDSLMTEALTLGAQLKRPALDTELIMAAANNLALQ